ncbi:hypothetical protein GF351_03430 [Candidatus Woesearchaeota archaeon]|nr:hypothetical protein [Candidatus Woesearchaeota archaeon]
MKKTILLPMIVLMIIVALAGSVSAFCIAGKVTSNLDGSPVEDVNVTLKDFTTGTYINSSLTGADGLFNFSVPTEKKYLLNATKIGWHYHTQQANASSYVNFVLGPKPFIEVSGKVYEDNESGNFLEDATVTALISGSNVGTDKSESDGDYALNVWNDTTYTFRATKPGYYTNTSAVTYVDGNLTLHFSLKRKPDVGVMNGYVFDNETGLPVQGAAVKVLKGTGVFGLAYTDSDGYYWTEVTGNIYNATASKAQYYYATRNYVQIDNGQTTQVNFTLSKYSFIVCTDQDLDGYFLEGDVCGTAADCDDQDPAVNPGATEVCNSKDDDCDGKVDENNVCGGDGGDGGDGGNGGGGYSARTYILDMEDCLAVQKMHEKDVAKYTYLGREYEIKVMDVVSTSVKLHVGDKTIIVPVGRYYRINYDDNLEYDVSITVLNILGTQETTLKIEFLHLCRPEPEPVVEEEEEQEDGSDDEDLQPITTNPQPDKPSRPAVQEDKDDKPFDMVTGRVTSDMKMLKANWIVGILLILAIIVLGMMVYWFYAYYKY